jgi:hypothetical protein
MDYLKTAVHWLHDRGRYRWLGVIAGVAMVGMGVFLSRQGAALSMPAAPDGGVSLQFALFVDHANAIIAAWTNEAQIDRARRQVQYDFGFIVSYAGFLLYLGLAAARVAQRAHAPELERLALAGAAAGVLAGIADACENFGLLIMIGGTVTAPVAALTTAFATLKFLLLGVSILAAALARFEATHATADQPDARLSPAGKPS